LAGSATEHNLEADEIGSGDMPKADPIAAIPAGIGWKLGNQLSGEGQENDQKLLDTTVEKANMSNCHNQRRMQNSHDSTGLIWCCRPTWHRQLI
jgi:hypothetical protein